MKPLQHAPKSLPPTEGKGDHKRSEVVDEVVVIHEVTKYRALNSGNHLIRLLASDSVGIATASA